MEEFPGEKTYEEKEISEEEQQKIDSELGAKVMEISGRGKEILDDKQWEQALDKLEELEKSEESDPTDIKRRVMVSMLNVISGCNDKKVVDVFFEGLMNDLYPPQIVKYSEEKLGKIDDLYAAEKVHEKNFRGDFVDEYGRLILALNRFYEGANIDVFAQNWWRAFRMSNLDDDNMEGFITGTDSDFEGIYSRDFHHKTLIFNMGRLDREEYIGGRFDSGVASLAFGNGFEMPIYHPDAYDEDMHGIFSDAYNEFKGDAYYENYWENEKRVYKDIGILKYEAYKIFEDFYKNGGEADIEDYRVWKLKFLGQYALSSRQGMFGGKGLSAAAAGFLLGLGTKEYSSKEKAKRDLAANHILVASKGYKDLWNDYCYLEWVYDEFKKNLELGEELIEKKMEEYSL